MDELRIFLSENIAKWDTLSRTCLLTPHLRDKVRSTRAAFEAISAQSEYDVNTINIVEALHNSLEKHWSLVYGDTAGTALLFEMMALFASFLEAKLEEDYVGKGLDTVYQRILRYNMIRHGPSERNSAALQIGVALCDLDNIYRQQVTVPLEEMTLDKIHVETRIDAVAQRNGKAGNDVQPFITASDWLGLEIRLNQDQALASKLFKRDGPQYKRQKAVLRAIERLRKKHRGKKANPGVGSSSDNPPPYEDACHHEKSALSKPSD